MYPLKKKGKNTLKSSSIFIFITMAHTAQNNSKKKVQRNLQIMSYNTKKKKKVNFIYNQLECLFFFFFISKTKYIYDFSKPKSQTPKDSKWITTFTKSTTFDFNIKTVSFHHLNKKRQSPFFGHSLLIRVWIKWYHNIEVMYVSLKE